MQVTMYTKPDCPYCVSAKQLLRNNQIPFNELVLNEDFTREHLKSIYPEAKTYPVIVVDGMNVGGFKELKEYVVDNTDNRKLLNEAL